jgi:hypothetical protein
MRSSSRQTLPRQNEKHLWPTKTSSTDAKPVRWSRLVRFCSVVGLKIIRSKLLKQTDPVRYNVPPYSEETADSELSIGDNGEDELWTESAKVLRVRVMCTRMRQ